MEYNLVLLKGTNRICAEITQLNDMIYKLAVNSYDTTKWKNGTMGQIVALQDYTYLRDRYLILRNVIVDSIKQLTPAYRQLLVRVYVKQEKPKDMATQYKVKLSAFYKQVENARRSFAKQLSKHGCTKDWLTSEYGDIDWLMDLLSK